MIREMFDGEILKSQKDKPLFVVDGYKVMKVEMVNQPSQVTLSFFVRSDKMITSSEINLGKIIENTELKKTLVEKRWIQDDDDWTCLIPLKRREFGGWEEEGKLCRISLEYLKE